MKYLHFFSKTLIAISCIVLLSFNTQTYAASTSEESGLSQREAALRAKQINSISYQLELTLPEQAEDFQGKATLNFNFNSQKAPLRIDFTDGQIKKLVINGKPQANVNYNQAYLTIPAQALKLGPNTITINYMHPYSNDGAGLYRFKDPEDGNTYLYSNFEPYEANKMFPAFDQPDLKATFQLTVHAPAKWTVISATRENKVTEPEANMRTWSFPITLPISTYVFSMHAGPYHIWEDNSGKIPLRLFARQTFAKHINPLEWFRITQQGFKFFEDYFAFAYPFKKYDQLVVPDFNAGAMENVAAVTFYEGFFLSDKMSAAQYKLWAEVILHEMAHMWFGNIVTMRWWNDLWLNESFATYMSYLALDQKLELPDTWLYFFYSKVKAYLADGLVTTHPILAETSNTAEAESQFDHITYNKGGAVLKQLDFYLSDDNFRKGIRQYLQRYAYQNAELQDFIASLSDAAKKDLKNFTKEWLTTTGFNQVEVKSVCQKQQLTELVLLQANEPLRNHKTKLGLFNLQPDGKVTMDTLPVSYNQAKTRFTTHKAVCPDFIYANYADKDYIADKFTLKDKAWIKANIAKITEPLTRAMLWESLWQQVLTLNEPLPSYLKFVKQNIAAESHPLILQSLFSTVTKGMSYLSTDSAKAKAYREQYTAHFEQRVWESLIKAAPGSDLQQVWLTGFINLASQPESLAHLVELLTGKQALEGLPIDKLRRWEIIKRLAMFDHKQAKSLLQAEMRQDKSSTGQMMALAARVSKPDLASKRKWFAELIGENTLSLAQQREIIHNLFPNSQQALLQQFIPTLYKELPKLNARKSQLFMKEFSRYAAPTLCSADSAKQLKKFLQLNPHLNVSARKELLEAQQLDERCYNIRNLAEQALS